MAVKKATSRTRSTTKRGKTAKSATKSATKRVARSRSAAKAAPAEQVPQVEQVEQIEQIEQTERAPVVRRAASVETIERRAATYTPANDARPSRFTGEHYLRASG